jgi:hypothetical protein
MPGRTLFTAAAARESKAERKPKTAKDGYSDSYFSEGEIYQLMQEGEEARAALAAKSPDGTARVDTPINDIGWHLSAAAHLAIAALAHWREGQLTDALTNTRQALDQMRIAEAQLSAKVFESGQ